MYPTDQPLWYAPYQYWSALMICSATDIDQPLCYASCPFRSALMICSLSINSDQPSWYALYPLIPISPCSMPPADSYQPLWYARQSTDSDQPLLDFSLFISISPYDVPPTDSDQLSWYAPQPVPISPSFVPPFQCDQPPCYVPYRHRSVPLIYPLPMPISPSMIYPYRCRSDLASLIFPPGRGYQPLWYAPIHFVNLRWTSKHTQFNPPIFINKSLEKYKHTGPGCSKVG